MTVQKSLVVEWRHAEGEGEPCYRCSDTGHTFIDLLDEVIPLLESDGITVKQTERLVQAGTRNRIYLNGRPLEELLDEAGRAQTYCHSTKWMMLEEARRAVIGPDGVACQEAPEILFRKSILKSLEE
ncbi:MAG TPA: DUF2703 domain-containing protein [Methanoregulaceae archaeon]|nr:DUF2703 domain-containing protein [Methanoregulaceae archaeon]